MKYSILGTNGFLSTAIAKYCNEKGYTVAVYGLGEPLGHKYDSFHEVDLMKGDLPMDKLLDSDVIVYAIGAGIQSNLKENNELIYTLNVTRPISICNQLRMLDYKGTFVTFGSVFEMGETTIRRPFTEEELLTSLSKAPNDYTTSKRILSRFVDSYSHNFTHWHFYIPTIYGKGENPLRLIPYTVNALKNETELHFTSGEQIRQYIHVDEVPKIVDACWSAKVPSGLYNLEGRETLSVREIVSIIHEAFHKEVADGCFGSESRKDVGMKYLALDGSKLTQYITLGEQQKIKDVCLTY